MSRARGAVVAIVTGLGIWAPAVRADFPAAPDLPGTFEGPAAPAGCGPGSRPESALQGEVPAHDRDDGRSAKGYACNLVRVGRWQGQGASWVNPSYDHCAYLAEHYPSGESQPGVRVLDASDAAHPKLTATLASPAMLGTWETLKVNAGRRLLGAVSALNPIGQGVAFLDLYDVSDCAHPKLLNSVSGQALGLPANTLGHEGDFSPDGRTYWSTNAYTGVITAIDVADPTQPRVLYVDKTGSGNHGFGFSPDGTRLYLAEAGRLGSGILLSPLAPEDLASPNGLQVFDVSEIQHRVTAPQIHQLGALLWDDGAAGQHAIHVTYRGHPYLIFVDELLSGGPRIIDIADETHPRVVAKLKLAIQMPQYESLRKSDTSSPVLFGYDSHYCTVDRATNPTALACGEFASGVRVFDIRDPRAPRELGYYNPPAQVGKSGTDLPASEHAATGGDMTTDWCSSPPRFVGSDELWVTCQDNGFMTLRFTNGAWPFPERGETGTAKDLGLPAATTCKSRRDFTIRLRAPRGARLRSARVYVAGKRVRVLRARGRLRARVDLRGLGRATVGVRVVARTARGRVVRRSRTYHTCVHRPPPG